jgi:hypothetical protein
MSIIYWELRYFLCELLFTFYYNKNAAGKRVLDEKDVIFIRGYLDAGEYDLAFEGTISLFMDSTIKIGHYRYQKACEITKQIGLDNDQKGMIVKDFWSNLQKHDPGDY